MKVSIFGSTGMAGIAVSKYFETAGLDVKKISRADYDIAKDKAEKISDLIQGSDFVVNCSGVIKPLIAKNTIEDVLRVNVVFPQNLAKVSKALGVKCFHLTTDCVYSGLKGKYSELDLYDADDVYGMSKNGGEPRDCMTLRTSIIGEERGQGRSLIAWAMSQKGQAVNGFTNHFWNGVTTLCFAQSVHSIMQSSLYAEGLFHLHSPNTVTKAEMLRIFDRVYNLNLKITEVQSPVFCDRSIRSIHPLTQLVTKSIEEQVLEMRDFFRKHF